LHSSTSKYSQIVTLAILVAIVIAFAIFAGYFISQEGIQGGMLMIAAAFGLLFAISSFLFPVFGFYFTVCTVLGLTFDKHKL